MEILKTIIEGIKNFITCVIGIIAMPIIVFWPFWLLVIIGFVFDRCSSDNSKQKPKTEHVITSSIVSDEDDEEDEEGETYENNGFDDGTYLATVDYFNPETAFSNTYTLEVGVVDNQVVTIYFPNGGYISTMEELDEDGQCTVYGEDGKTYDIKLDY